ncbi:ATP dependent DNA ligase domain-containing protein [Lipomyces tetrasporus]|uniref:ATP dependent DNA ligase domain-containing protein n=1 Tax=Lipomyces tetrasporus TaxID=54092 RepID=A0AAD7QLG4_9ASCO|nr:ATP dependent DNA ligase domain-containing protein [Lipomyces tetrasporus]KAJ8097399.1 ATP dependent DNA ligase domain-containing protein [Lipomyces tetrasporus]
MGFQFSEICNLLETVECIDKKAVRLSLPSKIQKQKYIHEWFCKHRSLILEPPGDQAIAALSCLFPELRPDRVYGLFKKDFVRSIIGVLGMKGTDRGRRLLVRVENKEELATAVADSVALAEHSRPRHENAVTVNEVDTLFMNFASTCKFSRSDVYKSSKFRVTMTDGRTVRISELLRPILVRLQSFEIKWLIRMTEKDMQPVILPVDECFHALHFALPSLQSFHSDLTVAVKLLFKEPYDAFLPLPAPVMTKLPQYIDGVLNWLKPTVGVPVRIPSCYKARKFSDVQTECKFEVAWAETKYDGERMQIHLSIDPPFIKIFSKSGRESTDDRARVHEAIRKALRISEYSNPSSPAGFQKSVILEAELVVFDEYAQRIAEFHRISDHVNRAGVRINAANDSSRKHEHLMAVFFDVLCVDGTSLLSHSYEYRRSVLESLISEIPGNSMLVQRQRVDLKDLETLKQVFNSIVNEGEEGIVVKRATGTYIGACMAQGYQRWVKVKRDYIAGLGDTADFAIVGAGTDTGRIKERRLDANCITTFYVGCLRNKEAVKRFAARPTFEVLFVVTYGLDRQLLERINEIVQSFSKPYHKNTAVLEYDLHIQKYMKCAMTVYFPNPFVFEVLCAGFDKPAGNSFYVMRWPRVVKVHFDRDWVESTSFDELQNMAERSLQHGRNCKSDCIRSSSPAASDIHRKWKRAKDLPMLDFEAILGPKPNPAHKPQPRPQIKRLVETASALAVHSESPMHSGLDIIPAAPPLDDVVQHSADLDKLRYLLQKSTLIVSKSLDSRRDIGKLFQLFTNRKSFRLEPIVSELDLLKAKGKKIPSASKGTLTVLIVEGRKPRTSHQEISNTRSLIAAQYHVRERETYTAMNLSDICLHAVKDVASLLVIDWRILLAASASSSPIDLSSYFILHEIYC